MAEDESRKCDRRGDEEREGEGGVQSDEPGLEEKEGEAREKTGRCPGVKKSARPEKEACIEKTPARPGIGRTAHPEMHEPPPENPEKERNFPAADPGHTGRAPLRLERHEADLGESGRPSANEEDLTKRRCPVGEVRADPPAEKGGDKQEPDQENRREEERETTERLHPETAGLVRSERRKTGKERTRDRDGEDPRP